MQIYKYLFAALIIAATQSAFAQISPTWSITSGALPPGLSLNSSSGVISGTPATANTYIFTVQASDSYGTDSKQLALTVNQSAATLYKLVSVNSGLCLDVPGGSTQANVQLQQWTCHGGTNQQFSFKAVSGGNKITAQNSGLSLNIRGGSTSNGAAVIQWPYSGTSNEIWNAHPNTDGSYTFTVNSTTKCMDVNGVSKSNGALVQQWSCNGQANQKWKMVRVQ